MSLLRNDLEKIAKDELIKGNYNGNIFVEEFFGTPRFKAETNMKTGDIFEYFNSEYEKENPNKTTKVISDLSFHEVNHHRYGNCIGCPQTLEKHVSLFFEPMSDVLLDKGFSYEDVKYVTNALEDTILHYDGKVNERRKLDGVKLFFEEVGNSTQNNKINKRKFTKFYEAHVKLNMYLWGNKQQKKCLARFYTHDKIITEVMKNFVRDTKNLDFLNEDDWQQISRIYAEEFSKLMEPNYAMPLPNHSGQKTNGKSKGMPTSSDKNEGNVFDKKMKTKRFKQNRVKYAHKRNAKSPDWIDHYEALNLLYESLAQEMVIKSKVFSYEEKLPISWYGKRDFDRHKDNFDNISFDFDASGKAKIKKYKFHDDIPLEVKTSPNNFPRLRYGLIDTSGSMEESIDGLGTGKTNIIPWGDNSKYHYAILAWYGFLEYLKANNLLLKNSIDLANFSDETIIGQGLIQAKKVALDPQFGSTYLDKNKISNFFRGKDNLIFTISDGQIMNWDSISEFFIKNAKKHQYFHLQIGKENSFTTELSDSGLYVTYVKGDKDLVEKTIDLTDRAFRK